jgi:hypothetical protein
MKNKKKLKVDENAENKKKYKLILEKTNEIIAFQNAINKLKEYGESLKKDESTLVQSKASSAIELYKMLNETLNNFIENVDSPSRIKVCFQNFQLTIKEILDTNTMDASDIKPETQKEIKEHIAHLRQHQEPFKVIIANIGIAFIPIAGPIALLIKAAHSYGTKGHVEGFFQSKGQTILEKIDETIEKSNAPKI